jgi:hypothetical protein
MGKIVDIPWVGGSKYYGWGGGQNTMDRGVKIPWVWGSIYHGEVFKIPWVVGSKYHG